jgi:hypothetical protein
MNNNNDEIKILNVEGLVQSLKVLKEVLDTAVKNGNFNNIDSAYLAKQSLDNLETTVVVFNTHQQRYINVLKAQQAVQQAQSESRNVVKESL